MCVTYSLLPNRNIAFITMFIARLLYYIIIIYYTFITM